MGKLKKLIKSSPLLLVTLMVEAQPLTYIVKGKDTLSTIAKRSLKGALYGKNGSLNKLLTLNSHIKNKNLIFPGTKIYIFSVEKAQRVPASEEVQKPSDTSLGVIEEHNPTSHLKVGLGYDYFNIDAYDPENKDTATVVSEASPKIGLNWNLEWSKDWSSEFSFSYRQDRIAVDADSAKKLDKKTYARTAVAFGLNRHWSSENKTLFFVGRSERGFLKAKNATEIEMLSGTSTDFGLKHEKIFITRNTASAGFDASYTYLGAAQGAGFSSDPGYYAQAGIFMRHKMKSFLLEARGSYGMWEQNTSFIDQKAKEIGTALAVSWDFE